MSIVHRDASGRIVARASICLCGEPKAKKRRMCHMCEADPVKRNGNLLKMRMDRWEEQVELAAERETAGLPKGEPLVPLALNRLIDEWGR